MSKYRSNLPQLGSKLFLTDGGMGTTLLFKEGLELPHFCAFHLLDSDAGQEILFNYYRGYARIAQEFGTGLVLDSGPTWRASADWGEKLGYSQRDLYMVNRRAIEMMVQIREQIENEQTPVVVSGCLGPRGDGYEPGRLMTADEAQRYHAKQVDTFSGTQADLVTAMTLTYAEEAIGITRAALESGLPAVISFTVETDGRLPTGQDLRDAVNLVDDATSGGPAYYMVNCAHPSHFKDVLKPGKSWTDRIKGIRLNASYLSHAELNEATELDDGDPEELGTLTGNFCRTFPAVNVVGGCCGTDQRHIREIAVNLQKGHAQ